MSECQRLLILASLLMCLLAAGCAQDNGTAADVAPPSDVASADTVSHEPAPAQVIPAQAVTEDAALKTDAAPEIGASVSNVAAAPADAGSGGIPDIEFEELEHNFGTVAGQAKVANSFVFRNKGTGTLIIENVRGGWGCTATLVSNREVPPGGEGSIEVTFNTGTYRGQKSKTVRVETNDPDETNITLTVSAFIEVDFDVNPRSINVGRLHKNAEFTKRIDVEGKDLSTLQLTEVKSSNEFVKAEIVIVDKDGQKVPAVDVIVKPGLPVGRIRENVTIKSNRESTPEISVGVYGEILGDISFTPQRVHFGYFPKGQEPERTVNLDIIPENLTFKITEVQDTSGVVKTAVETVEDGRHYKINLKVVPEFDQRRLSGKLLVKTDFPGQEIIEIPLFGGLRDAAGGPEGEGQPHVGIGPDAAFPPIPEKPIEAQPVPPSTGASQDPQPPAPQPQIQ